MKVYLVADHGHKTAFKITTARVFTSLDTVFDGIVTDILARTSFWYDTDFDSAVGYTPRSNLYTVEVDDIENVAKKVRGDEWKALVAEYKTKYPEKVKEVNDHIKIIRKEKGQDE